MRVYYIYKYTNLIHLNKKIYVGQTVNFKRRKSAHKRDALSGENGCPRFYHAIRKYGYENFKCEIIEVVYGQEAADDREIYWIKELKGQDRDFGMNVEAGGRNSCGGRRLECNTKTHKYCPYCREIKLRDDFYTNNCNSDGLGGYCKKCDLEMHKKRWGVAF